MERRFYLAGLSLALALGATQGAPVYVSSGGAPTGSCSGERVWLTKSNPSDTYCCINSTWARCGVGTANPIPNCAPGEFVTADGGGFICQSIALSETDPLSYHIGALSLCSPGCVLNNTDAGVSCVCEVSQAKAVSGSCAIGYFLRATDAGTVCAKETDPTLPDPFYCMDEASPEKIGGIWQCGYPRINQTLGQENGQVPVWNGDAGVWTAGPPDPALVSSQSNKWCVGVLGGKFACTHVGPIDNLTNGRVCTGNGDAGSVECTSYGVSQTCSTGQYAWWNGSGWGCGGPHVLPSDVTSSSQGWVDIDGTNFAGAGGAGATIAVECSIGYTVSGITGGLALGIYSSATVATSYETTVYSTATINVTASGTARFCNSNNLAVGDGGCAPTTATTAATTVYRASLRGMIGFGSPGSFTIRAHGAGEQSFTIKAGSWCRFDNAY